MEIYREWDKKPSWFWSTINRLTLLFVERCNLTGFIILKSIYDYSFLIVLCLVSGTVTCSKFNPFFYCGIFFYWRIFPRLGVYILHPCLVWCCIQWRPFQCSDYRLGTSPLIPLPVPICSPVVLQGIGL